MTVRYLDTCKKIIPCFKNREMSGEVYIFSEYHLYCTEFIIMVSEDYNIVKECFDEHINRRVENTGYVIHSYRLGDEYDYDARVTPESIIRVENENGVIKKWNGHEWRVMDL